MKFVVNAHGTVHAVDDELFRVLIESGQFREAKEKDIRRWYEEQGLKYAQANPEPAH